MIRHLKKQNKKRLTRHHFTDCVLSCPFICAACFFFFLRVKLREGTRKRSSHFSNGDTADRQTQNCIQTTFLHSTVLLVTPHIHYCIQRLASEQQDSLKVDDNSVHNRWGEGNVWLHMQESSHLSLLDILRRHSGKSFAERERQSTERSRRTLNVPVFPHRHRNDEQWVCRYCMLMHISIVYHS